MSSTYGQHMERLERQALCKHVWSDPRPYPGSSAGIWMVDCKRCWKTMGGTREELTKWTKD